MIRLQNVKQTKVMYLRKEDILHMEQDDLDGDGFDVEIIFKEYICTDTLTIEDIKLDDVISRLDSGSRELLIREFYI